MARKVFISVLGTGFYGECQYAKGGFRSTPTRFIQQAMMEYHNVKSWSEDDRAYILLTDKARKENWNIPSGKRMNRNTNEEEDYLGLEEVLADIPAVRDVSIPDGKDEEEMWQIFSIVFDLLEDEDELYIELTHSFRYLPMLLLVLTNYAHFLKHIEVKAVGYGNYEARMRETNIAPIVDLLPLVALQRWTFAASNFTENGDVKQLLALSNPELSRRLSESKGADIAAKSLNGFMKQLDTFIDEVKLCRGVSTFKSESFRKMNDFMPNTTAFIKPLAPILKNILQSLTLFSTQEGAANCFAAAKWCCDKGLYQPAVTELQEGIVTYFCRLYGIPISDHSQREIVNRAFKKKLKPQDYRPTSKECEELKVDEIVQGGYLSAALVNMFADLTDIRNDYNHAGMRDALSYPKRPPRKASQLIASIKKYIDDYVPIFMNGLEPLPRLFLNLSNHPSTKWCKEQLEAAAAYGTVQDMPFPQVDPLASEEDVEALAKECVAQILKLAQTHRVSVHVMGEMGLTFSMVQKLQANGIECLSSTSYRVAKNLLDGSKQVVFQFQRFRRYGE